MATPTFRARPVTSVEAAVAAGAGDFREGFGAADTAGAVAGSTLAVEGVGGTIGAIGAETTGGTAAAAGGTGRTTAGDSQTGSGGDVREPSSRDASAVVS